MNNFSVKKIITLGPSTNTEYHLRKMKDQGVDFVRVNMSHSDIDALRHFISLSKKAGLSFVIDTEGSQIRTGDLKKDRIFLKENDEIKIYKNQIAGDEKKICLHPSFVLSQLEEGDILHLDFDTLILRISDTSTIKKGYIRAKAISAGFVGKNKAVVVDSSSGKKIELSPLSKKDYQSIALGLREKIGYIAASFIRSGDAVEEVKKATKGLMKIISKIECVEALNNLEKIIKKSDYLLIDRGDLSKEISIEKIPLVQKIIIQRAHKYKKKVFVATNLLETMVKNRRPTRAEVHDIIQTVLDGADGLALAAETAIGEHPLESINMLNKLIGHAQMIKSRSGLVNKKGNFWNKLESENYLLDFDKFSSLVPPHGSHLIDRILKEKPNKDFLKWLPKIKLTRNQLMDVEQIAIGTFSPLEGFMGKKDFESVVNNLRLTNGVIWPLPIVLDVSEEKAKKLKIGKIILLVDEKERKIALFHLKEKYRFDKERIVKKIYGTDSEEHPGVRMIKDMKPVLLGGKIDLINRCNFETREYELTPKQVRKLFEERNWIKVAGFHTRNVIHRGHEFIQMEALERENCDGLFVHPVIGTKKAGDFSTSYIIKSYERMLKSFYPKNKVLLAVFSTYSRYAGPREALFTAICRKNFGCSHFIVGRDHTGVSNFYQPYASQNIFDRFPDLGIKIIKFGEIFYSKKLKKHVHLENYNKKIKDKLNLLSISGAKVRKILESRKKPPEWFMRPEISREIIKAIRNKEGVFVKKDEKNSGIVIWFTGLSGSGKTTIANKLKNKLISFGKKAEILDGDILRNNQHKHLGFSKKDIKENNRLIAELAKERAKIFDFILVPIISPFRDNRSLARSIIGGNFIELFIRSSLKKCIERDVKGLYKKALDGEIKNLIGFNKANPYEIPKNPDYILNTEKKSVNKSVNKLVTFLKNKKLIK